jgi:hypothetical protein
MWYRYFRCGIGIFPLRPFSDTTSEIISNRVVVKKIDDWALYEIDGDNKKKIQECQIFYNSILNRQKVCQRDGRAVRWSTRRFEVRIPRAW